MAKKEAPSAAVAQEKPVEKRFVVTESVLNQLLTRLFKIDWERANPCIQIIEQGFQLVVEKPVDESKPAAETN